MASPISCTAFLATTEVFSAWREAERFLQMFSLHQMGAETEKRYKEDGSVRHICNNKNTATVKSSLS